MSNATIQQLDWICRGDLGIPLVQSMLTNVFVLVAIYYAVILSLRLIQFAYRKIQTSRVKIRRRKIQQLADFLAQADHDRLYQRAKQLGLVKTRVRKEKICILLAQNILYPSSAPALSQSIRAIPAARAAA